MHAAAITSDPHFGGGVIDWGTNGQLAIGGYSGRTAELIQGSNVTTIAPVPGSGTLWSFSMVNFKNTIYIFGGFSNGENTSKSVYSIDSAFEWTKLANLLQSRAEHRSIVLSSGSIVHTGGYSPDQLSSVM